jgi:dienelactone hydrolase
VRLRFSAALVAVVAVSGTPAAHAATTQLPPLPRIAPSCVESDFTSARRTVRARLCLPDGASQTRRVPGVIVLHGCGGFGTLDQTLAHRLPEHGIATYYVDYFGLTPPPNRKGFCNAHGAVGDAFATWVRITRDATAALRRILAVDPQHVGAVGWSLGGGLALTAAEQYRHLFATLVLFSAFAFGPELQDVGRLPPTLVLSGGSGDVCRCPTRSRSTGRFGGTMCRQSCASIRTATISGNALSSPPDCGGRSASLTNTCRRPRTDWRFRADRPGAVTNAAAQPLPPQRPRRRP